MTVQPPSMLERRVATLEARLNELEVTHGSTLYELRRDSVETKLNVSKILQHLGIAPTTRQEVDALLDEG
jgi:hypothetical protein